MLNDIKWVLWEVLGFWALHTILAIDLWLQMAASIKLTSVYFKDYNFSTNPPTALKYTIYQTPQFSSSTKSAQVV